MKRIISIILCLCMLIALSACAHEHSFGEWETVKEASCIKEGSERRTCKCGEEEIRSIPINDVHEFDEYGYCKNCNKISDETMENLVYVVKTVCSAAWILRYINDADHPGVDNITVEFDSLTHEVSKPAYSSTGLAIIDFNGNYYTGNFAIDFTWEDEESRFVRDDGTFDDFYVCDSTGEVFHGVFSSQKTLTHTLGYGKAKSVLIFGTNGDVTLESYNSSGALVDISHAEYDYVITRVNEQDDCWIITTVSGNGHTETMNYYPGLDALMWGEDAYLHD